MKVLDGQQFGLAVFEPLRAGEGLAFWAMTVAAAVVGGALVAAGVTLLQVAAQGGSTAEFDSAHHAPLPARERSRMFLPISCTVTAEDIRHFDLRTLHEPAGSEILGLGGLCLSGSGLREQIKGTGGGAHLTGGNF